MKDTFSTYHPIINFLYFFLILALSMTLMHPVCLVISLLCAFTYAVYLNGRKALRFGLVFMLPTMMATALINPAFNHAGATILTYLSNGNPLTLESIVYGIAAAMMLVTVTCWFSCFNVVINTDKIVYIFGRIMPSLSLVLSMAMRFVPRFKAQIKVISNAQKCIGRDVSNGGVIKRARHGIRILSIMVTWALENSIETADSMKSRGYGLSGRTAFSIFRFDRRDRTALIYLFVCGGYITAGIISNGMYFRYFPTIKGVFPTPYSISLFAVYIALCIMPVVLNVREDIMW